MRRFFNFLLAGSFLFIGSCCGSKFCDNSSDRTIELRGFQKSDIRSVELITYIDGSKVSIDGVGVRDKEDYLTAEFNSPVKPKPGTTTYQLKINPSNEIYTIDGFELGEEVCNNCFPVTPPGQYYEVLRAYNVNGKRQQGSLISIFKQ